MGISDAERRRLLRMACGLPVDPPPPPTLAELRARLRGELGVLGAAEALGATLGREPLPVPTPPPAEPEREPLRPPVSLSDLRPEDMAWLLSTALPSPTLSGPRLDGGGRVWCWSAERPEPQYVGRVLGMDVVADPAVPEGEIRMGVRRVSSLDVQIDGALMAEAGAAMAAAMRRLAHGALLGAAAMRGLADGLRQQPGIPYEPGPELERWRRSLLGYGVAWGEDAPRRRGGRSAHRRERKRRRRS